jgi:hypothetical protein
MNNLDKIKQLKSWGMNLTPANYSPDNKERDKLPVAVKNGDGKKKWNINGTSKVWSDEELAAALENKRLAVYHNPGKYGATGQRFFDAESDDKTFRVNKYMKLWPETFTIGKVVNGVTHETHKLYKLPKNVEVKQYSYAHKNEGTKVELLCSGVSIIDGLDRLIINDKEPVEADPKVILQHLKLSTFLAEIEPDWKEKVKKRDEAHLTLAATLAKQTDLPTKLKESYIRLFCKRVGDEEVNKRVTKVKAQEEAFKKGEEIQGIDALAKLLGGNYKSFDELKREDLLEDKEEKEERKPYPVISSREFSFIEYPPVEFVMEPLLTDKSTNQIFGGYGGGKTILGLGLAIHISSGLDFLDYKCVKEMPCLYVEGELPSVDIRERRDSILNHIFEEKGDDAFKPDNLFHLSKDDLEMRGFKYGFDRIAVSRNMSDTEAKDYGRKGRELIDEVLINIEKKTGKKPFLFLDNISALSDIDENRSTDWMPLIHWLTHLKTKGFPSCFFHHSNKQKQTSNGSSGSNAKERLLDTSIQVEKLEHDQRFEMTGAKNMQCRVVFDKARNFGGSTNDTPFLLTMNENGVWRKYPDLRQSDFKIVDLWKQGIRTAKELAKNKELKLARKTIYGRITILKNEGLISDTDPLPTKEKEDLNESN